MSKRRWNRKGRVYRFSAPDVQAFVFGAEGMQMWAWAVWGHKHGKEGVAHSLKRAKADANQWIDAVLIADKSGDAA